MSCSIHDKLDEILECLEEIKSAQGECACDEKLDEILEKIGECEDDDDEVEIQPVKESDKPS